MPILGIIDCETTGLSLDKDDVLEIAIRLYDSDLQTNIGAFSALLPSPNNLKQESHVSAIPEKAFDHTFVQNTGFAIGVLYYMISSADILVAHNASFDKGFLIKLFNLYGHKVEKPWICSFRHIKFPKEGKSKSLSYLALDHGIFASGAHRAMADTTILEELLKLVPDLNDQLVPKNKYAAILPYERREEAKSAGFRWDGDEKIWWKYMTEKEVLSFLETSTFLLELKEMSDSTSDQK